MYMAGILPLLNVIPCMWLWPCYWWAFLSIIYICCHYSVTAWPIIVICIGSDSDCPHSMAYIHNRNLVFCLWHIYITGTLLLYGICLFPSTPLRHGLCFWLASSYDIFMQILFSLMTHDWAFLAHSWSIIYALHSMLIPGYPYLFVMLICSQPMWTYLIKMSICSYLFVTLIYAQPVWTDPIKLSIYSLSVCNTNLLSAYPKHTYFKLSICSLPICDVDLFSSFIYVPDCASNLLSSICVYA